jgi:hypothetical protein
MDAYGMLGKWGKGQREVALVVAKQWGEEKEAVFQWVVSLANARRDRRRAVLSH